MTEQNILGVNEWDTTWNQYGLSEGVINMNGKPSDFKVVVRNGTIVHIPSTKYQLLPNEEAVKIAEESAIRAGLIPFSEHKGDWYIKMNDHVILDGYKAHALYASPRDFDVGGEKMYLGLGIHNSIDGSMGFGCGIFTFRHACKNMVFAGMRGYEQSFDDRRIVEAIYTRHTKGLGLVSELLEPRIQKLMLRVDEIIDAYNLMYQTQITEEKIKALKAKPIPKKNLPDYLQAEEATLPDLTEWNVYNDLTQAIWHNPKTSLTAKRAMFNHIHTVLPLKVRKVA